MRGQEFYYAQLRLGRREGCNQRQRSLLVLYDGGETEGDPLLRQRRVKRPRLVWLLAPCSIAFSSI
jgi:hypothetical protein